ncbi:hypothetical protein NKG94_25840 [Micromonospora sp. M12]
MYGWTDPMDPNGAPRRADRPTDEPAWLHDRPEPRSAYLFGDEPGQPGDDWHREQPSASPQSNTAPPAEPVDGYAAADAYTAAWPAHQPDGETGDWGDNRPVQDTSDSWHTEADPVRPAAGTPTPTRRRPTAGVVPRRPTGPARGGTALRVAGVSR